MATRKELTSIVARSLQVGGFVSEDSNAISRATDILVRVSEDLVAENAKFQAGLKELDVARKTFERKYFAAVSETEQWWEESRPNSEEYKVAKALLEHLEKVGNQYGITSSRDCFIGTYHF